MSFSAFNPYVNAAKIDKVAEHQSSSDTVLESLYDQVQDMSIYSTDETVVGEWLDGSKIYEKTFHTDEAMLLNSQAFTPVDFVSIPNAQLIEIEGRNINDSVWREYKISGFLTNAGVLQIISYRDRSVNIDTITVRFIKTSVQSSITDES